LVVECESGEPENEPASCDTHHQLLH
jgi:hypothetical protein